MIAMRKESVAFLSLIKVIGHFFHIFIAPWNVARVIEVSPGKTVSYTTRNGKDENG